MTDAGTMREPDSRSGPSPVPGGRIAHGLTGPGNHTSAVLAERAI